MNFTSRSETIDLGTPCRRTISLKNKVAMCEASSVLLHGMKCAILENLSTTTKIESLFVLVHGNPNTKYILMSLHGACGVGKGMKRPCDLEVDLALRHVGHRRTKRSS